MTTKQELVVREMLSGTRYYSLYAPRLSRRQVEELNRAGFQIRATSINGDDRSAGLLYEPADDNQFAARARECGIV